MMRQTPHSYEEVHDAIVNLLLADDWKAKRPQQFNSLIEGTAEFFEGNGTPVAQYSFRGLHPQDEEFVRDVFWDLFRLGYITLGMNNSNIEFPWFRLSHRGKRHLESREPWKFHDIDSFFTLLAAQGVSCAPSARPYLNEALQTFYTQCPLASCVMLGAAAEAEFDAFLQAASASPQFGEKLQRISDEKFIAARIRKFRGLMPELADNLGKEIFAETETHLDAIQSILRVARNEAGHPTGTIPARETVYVYLQLFIPFLKKLRDIESAVLPQAAQSEAAEVRT